MRRLFGHNSEFEFAKRPSETASIFRQLKDIGLVPIAFCLISFMGLLMGLVTGAVMIPGKTTLHIITLSENPIWFTLAMLFNAAISFYSAGFIWFRVLGR